VTTFDILVKTGDFIVEAVFAIEIDDGEIPSQVTAMFGIPSFRFKIISIDGDSCTAVGIDRDSE